MFKKILKWFGALVGLAVLGFAGFLLLAQHDPDWVLSHTKVASPEAGMGSPVPERQAYFGELHVHTNYSMDANVFGTQITPRMAYQFAKGEEMAIGKEGIKQRIASPLDFAAVTDHAEGLGMMSQCYTPGSGSYWNIECIGVRYKILLVFPRVFKVNTQEGAAKANYARGACGDDGRLCIQASRGVWEDIQNAANEHYQPGKFTTLIGFEYSPTLQLGGQMHRNVIFRGASVPETVFSAADGFAEDLLRWLDQRCTGNCRALAIPHNSNMSWGLQFGGTQANASPQTRESVALRAKYERLVEIFQAKGGSECTRGVGNSDEECGFENLFPACTPEQSVVNPQTGQHAPRCVAAADMVRNTLRQGILDEKKWGTNPYKFGVVAATDNHNGLAGDTSESNYNGHATPLDDAPDKRLNLKTNLIAKTLGMSMSAPNPGGLTGVWAEQNTRESIWDGLYRRESWGTSGTRVKLRFFGGYDLPVDLHTQSDRVKTAYAKGVAMGSDLGLASAGKVPRFSVWAARDVQSAPLQKLQIVKGWVDGNTTKEQVYDVACSDGLQPDAKTHQCADNGAKVNLTDCSISNDKGAAELATTWTDPDFKPEQSAFYYVRVLENPVCRYTQRDAIKTGMAHPEGFSPTVKERAWSSPIWYTPVQ